MTTITVPAPSVAGRHRRATRIRPLRMVTGALLALLAAGSIALATLVLLLHIGFAPVLSPSMVPTFAAGDLLLTKAEPADALRVGQIVVLPRPDLPGQRYAHRLISVRQTDDGPIVRTKGDANNAPDPQALRISSATVPVVVGHVPMVGRFALLGQRVWVKIGLILFVGACVLVAIRRAAGRGEAPHNRRREGSRREGTRRRGHTGDQLRDRTDSDRSGV